MDASSTGSGSTPQGSKEPSRRHRPTSSSPHNQRGLLRGLSDLQRASVSRQGSLKSRLLSSESFVKRLEEQQQLNGHDGCVNTIAWDETGEFLLSGSGTYTKQRGTLAQHLLQQTLIFSCMPILPTF